MLRRVKNVHPERLRPGCGSILALVVLESCPTFALYGVDRFGGEAGLSFGEIAIVRLPFNTKL